MALVEDDASRYMDYLMDYLYAKWPDGVDVEEFKPCWIYDPEMDWLEYLEEDCCTITEYQKGSNIALLRKWDGENYTGIVGIKVVGASETLPPEVLEAFKVYNDRRLQEWKDKVCTDG